MSGLFQVREYVGAFSLLYGGWVVWIISLAAELTYALIASTVISREFEGQSLELLKLTGLRAMEIAGGKVISVIYAIWIPLACLIGFRLAIETLTAIWYFNTVTDVLPVFSVTLVLVVVWLTDCVAPIILVIYRLTIGLFISTLTSTRAKSMLGVTIIFAVLVVLELAPVFAVPSAFVVKSPHPYIALIEERVSMLQRNEAMTFGRVYLGLMSLFLSQLLTLAFSTFLFIASSKRLEKGSKPIF